MHSVKMGQNGQYNSKKSGLNVIYRVLGQKLAAWCQTYSFQYFGSSKTISKSLSVFCGLARIKAGRSA